MVLESELIKPHYRVSEIAQFANVTSQTVRDHSFLGLINLYKPNDGWLYASKEEVIRYLDSRDQIVHDAKEPTIALYARVSSLDQEKSGDLSRQIADLSLATSGRKTSIFTDVGSGLNGKRTGLNKLFEAIVEGGISEVWVTTEDRLTRFGGEYLEFFFAQFGTIIHILQEEETKEAQQELVDDMMGLIASFSGRFYGLRSAEKRKARKVIGELSDD